MSGDVTRERLRAGRLALVAGSVIFVGKLGAWNLSGSTAVLSDALESVVNVVASGFMWLSLAIAARPADRDHPYGHGKVEFLSAGAEGGLVAAAALWIGFEALDAWMRGPELRQLGAGLAVLALFGAANLGLGLHLVRTGRRTRSAALEADGRHVLTDVWTTAGVVVGLLAAQWTGHLWLDPLIALVVAARILVEGWRLVGGAVRGLMDAADPALLGRIVAALDADREPGWIDLHGLRTWRAGASVHVDFHLLVPRYWSADRLHEAHARVERLLDDVISDGGDVVIHFDPCRPDACAGCAVEPCPVREAPLDAARSLSVASAVRDDAEVEGEPATARDAAAQPPR